MVYVIVLDFILRFPQVELFLLYFEQLLKVLFMHDASNEVAKPEHGRVLHPDRHLAVVLILQGVPHGRKLVQLVFFYPNWIVG